MCKIKGCLCFLFLWKEREVQRERKLERERGKNKELRRSQHKS